MNIFVFAAYPLALIYNAFESTTKFVRIFNYIVTLLIIVAVCIGFGVQNSIVSLALNG
jgi:1-phosphatidylinositol-4-phosphate 5-kinase